MIFKRIGDALLEVALARDVINTDAIERACLHIRVITLASRGVDRALRCSLRAGEATRCAAAAVFFGGGADSITTVELALGFTVTIVEQRTTGKKLISAVWTIWVTVTGPVHGDTGHAIGTLEELTLTVGER